MRKLGPLGAVVKPQFPMYFDLLGGQDLRLLHVLYESDAHLVSSTSEGGLLVLGVWKDNLPD